MRKTNQTVVTSLKGCCKILKMISACICIEYYSLKEQIDRRASLLAGVAKNTDNIMAKHMATSSLAAHDKAGESPLESTAVMDAPLISRVSTTSHMPKGAAKCRGLKGDS